MNRESFHAAQNRFLNHVRYTEEIIPNKKILLVTIPKAGTHLLRKAITLITKQPIHWIGLGEAPYFRPQNDLAFPHPITAGHLFPEMDVIRTDYAEHYIKILLIRDPRDVMLSFAHHLAKGLTWSSCPSFDHARFITLSRDEQLRMTLCLPKNFRDPSICFPYVEAWMQTPDVYVCRFEDLVGSCGGGTDEKQFHTLKTLSEHIGHPCTDEELHEIASKLFGNTWTFRKGQIGGWKSAYNAENTKLFKILYGPYIKNFGYEEHNTL